jgi:tungstate transport system ATP-binding protein
MAEPLRVPAPAPRAGGILPLRLEGVTYSAQGQALLGPLTFALQAGARTIVLGPNGAGKSLALRLCHGLLEPSAGRVRWLGPAGAQARERQAMVFQRPVLLRRSALANVTYALGVRGVGRHARRARALEALEQTGLAALARRPARVLSAGEQQRLALARAWALRPEVLFLDEPTASLDPHMADKTRRMLEQIQAERGTTVLITSHNMAEMEQLCDRILFIEKGRRLMEGTPREILTRYGRATLEEVFLDVARGGAPVEERA